MQFTINIQMKIRKNCIKNLKRYFLSKKKKLKWHFLRNRGKEKVFCNFESKRIIYFDPKPDIKKKYFIKAQDIA